MYLNKAKIRIQGSSYLTRLFEQTVE